MINEILLLIKKYTDSFIEQTKTKPLKILEFRINQQMQTSSFNPPRNLVEEGKWFLAVTSFGATNSVFHKIDGNNSFSITIPGQWESKPAENLLMN